jgi:hypothetical protein
MRGGAPSQAPPSSTHATPRGGEVGGFAEARAAGRLPLSWSGSVERPACRAIPLPLLPTARPNRRMAPAVVDRRGEPPPTEVEAGAAAAAGCCRYSRRWQRHWRRHPRNYRRTNPPRSAEQHRREPGVWSECVRFCRSSSFYARRLCSPIDLCLAECCCARGWACDGTGASLKYVAYG